MSNQKQNDILKSSRKTERRSTSFKAGKAKEILKILFSKKRLSRQLSASSPRRDLQDHFTQLQNHARAQISHRHSIRAPSSQSPSNKAPQQPLLPQPPRHSLHNQTDQMRQILDQYLKFIDKILADKEALIVQNQTLKGQLREAAGDGCRECERVKGFYQQVIQRLQRENYQEVERVRGQKENLIQEKEKEIVMLRKILEFKR